jgi:hypothetical protein
MCYAVCCKSFGLKMEVVYICLGRKQFVSLKYCIWHPNNQTKRKQQTRKNLEHGKLYAADKNLVVCFFIFRA